MKLQTYTPMSSPGVRNQEPFVKASGTSGHPCECGCSDGYWISVSDGRHGIRLAFDSERAYRVFVRALSRATATEMHVEAVEREPGEEGIYCPECGSRCKPEPKDEEHGPRYVCLSCDVLWEYVAEGINGPAYYVVERG